ncbi:peptidase, partial [Micromonospora craterilacus]
PTPTHLMYALDAGTGQARWLSHESAPQPWTDEYVDGKVSVADDFPGIGRDELLAGPAQAATLPAPRLDVLADTTTAGERTLRLRLTPQRQVRLATLHVDTSTAEVRAAQVAGRPVPVEVRDGRWGFGVVFHAPPPEGIEITLTLTPRAGQILLRAMDASDGLDNLPGFRPRPPDVGIAGSHTSEMLAVAHT